MLPQRCVKRLRSTESDPEQVGPRLGEWGGEVSDALVAVLSKSRAAVGTLEYNIEVQSCIEGPSDFEDIARWPHGVLDKVFYSVDGHGCKKRFLDLVGPGFTLTSDYSGMDAPSVMFRMLEVALRDECQIILKYHYACDKDKLCQYILQKRGAGRAEHIFTDVSHKLPPFARGALEGMAPPPSCTPVEAERCYKKMNSWLHDNRAVVYGKERHGQCLVHGGNCPVVPCADPNLILDQRTRSLTMNFSSSSCRPWSLKGSRLHYAHPDMAAYYTFIHERVVLQEDVVFHENSPNFPLAQLFTHMLSETHFVVSLTFNACDLGHPLQRRRQYSVALRRSAIEWLGPRTSSDLAQDFEKMFRRRVVLDGDVFFADSSERRLSTMKQYAFRRGSFVRDDLLPSQIDFVTLLSGTERDRLVAYHKVREQSAFLSNTLICDITQNPDFRNYSSVVMPTQTTNSRFVSLKHGPSGLPFTPYELMFAHGWPTIRCQACEEFTNDAKIKDLLKFLDTDIKDRQLVSLSGNALHLPSLASFVLYILGNCSRREAPSS